MDKVAEVIALVKRTGGTNDKQYILKRNEHVPGLKEILKFIYDPYLKTGISKSKLKKIEAIKANKSWPVCGGTYTWQDAIRYFSLNTTGSGDGLHFSARFLNDVEAAYPGNEDALMVAKGMITQDLKIGVTAKTLNTVYGGNFIPTIGCMLGTLVGEVKPEAIKWPAIVTKKHDGVRRLAIKEKGVTTMYSRSGHPDPYLDDIVAEMAYMPDNTVYDGELLAIGNFKNCIAQRQATNSIANKKEKKIGLTFNMFDMVPLDQFRAGSSNDGVELRKTLLGATLMDKSIALLDANYMRLIAAFGIHKELQFIKSTPILGIVHNLDQITPIVEAIWAAGDEGVMLNTAGSIYELKRTKTLLKIKHTEEMTLKIIDFKEGINDLEDSLGAFIVDYNGNRVGVGSGMDWPLRDKVWNNQEAYLGRMIEVDTFGESINAQGGVSINCPIFKRFAGEVE